MEVDGGVAVRGEEPELVADGDAFRLGSAAEGDDAVLVASVRKGPLGERGHAGEEVDGFRSRVDDGPVVRRPRDDRREDGERLGPNDGDARRPTRATCPTLLLLEVGPRSLTTPTGRRSKDAGWRTLSKVGPS